MRVADDPKALARILIAPALIYIGAVIGVPFVLSLWFAVSDVTVSSAAGNYVGLENFRSAMDDPSFRRALRNTFLFAVASQVIVVILATTLAVALQKDFRGKWIVRLLILLPWVAPVSLGSIGWLWILDSIFSPFDWFAQLLHIVPPGGHIVFLGQSDLAMGSLIALQTWRILPLATVILMAGLSAIPAEVSDAAEVDGAGFWRRLFGITLPLLSPVMTVALLFGIVFTFTDMAAVFVLTGGGPGNATQVLASWAFYKGINGGNLAGGAADAIIMFPVLLGLAAILLRIASRAEVS